MHSLSLATVAELIEVVAKAADPTRDTSLAERKLALVAEIARLTKTDVWIFTTGVLNPDVAGDAMCTCLADGGFRNEQERADFLRHIILPDMAAIAQRPLYDALTKRQSDTRSRRQMIDQRRWHATGSARRWNAIGFEDFILSVYPAGESGYTALGLHRRLGSPYYTKRDCTLVHLLFQHSLWLHQSTGQVSDPSELISLSPRERQVMIYLMKGDSRKQVAHKLRLSEHTVTDYLKEIYRKFNVNSRAELLAKFIAQEGLV